MRAFFRMTTVSLAVLLFAGMAAAQQPPTQDANRMIPLKVGIVLSEYDGAKKISSLPYTLDVSAAPGKSNPTTQLRVGVRIPITGSQGKIQYEDLGTNIGCSARAMSDGVYQLLLIVMRNSVRSVGAKTETEGVPLASGAPVIRSFRVSSTLVMRDGQSDESTVASDPFTGHLLRVLVTLHVEKTP